MSSLRGSVVELSGTARDVHSYAEPEKYRFLHLDLALEVFVDRKVLRGVVTLTIQRTVTSESPLVLDTRDLIIENVETSGARRLWRQTAYELGAPDAILGTPLVID